MGGEVNCGVGTTHEVTSIGDEVNCRTHEVASIGDEFITVEEEGGGGGKPRVASVGVQDASICASLESTTRTI